MHKRLGASIAFMSTPVLAIVLAVGPAVATTSSPTALPSTSLWSWGKGSEGLNANGKSRGVTAPAPASIGDVTQVSSTGVGTPNGSNTYFLRADGTVWAVGTNAVGELGDGTIDPTAITSTPVQVLGLSNIIQVAAGDQGGFALAADGAVWGWGLNQYGELGVPGGGYSSVPVHNPVLSQVVQIASGRTTNVFALRADGTV